MKIVRVVLAAGCGLVGLCVSTSASAGYGYCETYAPHQAARVTPMFEFPANAGSDGIDPDFEAYMEAKLGFNLMPMCISYGDNEARAREMAAYALADIKQDMHAILEEGFVAYVAQKYGSGRKSRPTPKAVADDAGRNDTSEADASAGPSAAELRAERHKAVEERNRAAQADYEAKLAAVEQAKRDIEARKAANRAAADKVLADHAREMEVHAQQVRMADAAALEYKKQVAKPYNAPNAVYRGFNGRDCAQARLSALKGAGTDSGTQFKEVESEMISGGCIVRGWHWSTQVGGSSRQ
jgi:hypothetical protein